MNTPGAIRIVQRNTLVYRRIWRGSLFSNFLQPTLFLASIGMGLGSLVGRGGQTFPGGIDYLHFLAPGLLAATAMQSASFESSFPVLGKFAWHRNYEAIYATPMRIVDVVLGELAWIGARQTMVAVAFTIVLTAFGIPRSLLALLAVPAAVLTGMAFSSVVMAHAATLKTSDNFNVMFRFIITPLFLFSGVFFPIARMPRWAQAVAWGTPLFHSVELIRGLMLGTLGSPDWAIHVGYLAAMLAAGTLMALRTFRRRLNA